MLDFVTLRRTMVDNQIRPGDVSDSAVIDAFLATPRELFVGEADRPFAYSDSDIKISAGAGRERWMISPVPLARMIAALNLVPEFRAMVIGCGTGYSAAILSQLAAEVVAVEEDTALADAAGRNLADLGIGNVAVVRGPLPAGAERSGPYDAILVDGAVQVIPADLMAQLKPGGSLATVELADRISRAVLCERVGRETTRWALFETWTNGVLPGFARTAEFVF